MLLSDLYCIFDATLTSHACWNGKWKAWNCPLAMQTDPALDGLDVEVREAEFPEKPQNTTRCQKCAYYSCFVGLSLVIAAVIA